MPTAGLGRSFGGLVTASSLRAHDCASLTNAEGPPQGIRDGPPLRLCRRGRAPRALSWEPARCSAGNRATPGR